MSAVDAVEALLKKLSAFETNNDFLSSLGAPARTST
jgi:transcription termination factor Rho